MTTIKETQTKVYTQSKLIDRTLKTLNKDKPKQQKLNRELIVQILSVYEQTIIDVLKETNEIQRNIIAKIFNGIRIEAEFIPEQIINLYGKQTKTKARISTNPKISKFFNYCKINGNSGMGN